MILSKALTRDGRRLQTELLIRALKKIIHNFKNNGMLVRFKIQTSKLKKYNHYFKFPLTNCEH